MRTLYEIRKDLHAGLERVYSLKTKPAIRKQRDKLQTLRSEAAEAMDLLFKEDDMITLDHSVNCTNAFGGGGWGCSGTVKIIGVNSTSLVVAAGDQALKIELLEDWKQWGSDSFWAFETALRERGQDIGFQARDHAMAYISKSLRGALSCRHAISVTDRIPMRKSKSYQQRLKAMIGELRNLKNQQFEAIAVAMAKHAADNNLTIVEAGVGTYKISKTGAV